MFKINDFILIVFNVLLIVHPTKPVELLYAPPGVC